MQRSLRQITAWCNGKLQSGSPETIVSGICTDSRTIRTGEIFVALRGERFDGHDFLASVRDRAAAVLVDQAWAETQLVLDTSIIIVADTLAALQMIAHHYRREYSAKGVAITGSNGKTTTKDLTAQVLAAKLKVLASSGNFNNHVGVPLTLLNLESHHAVIVTEMGMNHLGEIDRLAWIASPDVGVITNIGPAHLEFLKTIDNIYQAKLELANHVQTLFVNGDDPRLVEMARDRCPNVKTFGFSPACAVRADDVFLNGLPHLNLNHNLNHNQRIKFRVNNVTFELPFPGRHNVYNALAAIAVGTHFGLSLAEMAETLKRASLTQLRSEVICTERCTILNDSYNANPASLRAALAMLADYQTRQKRVAILGDMFELGENSADFHYEIGKYAAEQKIDRLLAIGPHATRVCRGAIEFGMSETNALCCATVTEARPLLENLIAPHDVALIKGSRGMRLEQLVDWLRELN